MSKKHLYNFYLEDDVKAKATEKLERLCGEKSKGQLSALLRVMLKQFVFTPDEKVNPKLIEAIDAEFEYCLKLNKRSNL